MQEQQRASASALLLNPSIFDCTVMLSGQSYTIDTFSCTNATILKHRIRSRISVAMSAPGNGIAEMHRSRAIHHTRAD